MREGGERRREGGRKRERERKSGGEQEKRKNISGRKRDTNFSQFGEVQKSRGREKGNCLKSKDPLIEIEKGRRNSGEGRGCWGQIIDRYPAFYISVQ